jgi:hypothetical protein
MSRRRVIEFLYMMRAVLSPLATRPSRPSTFVSWSEAQRLKIRTRVTQTITSVAIFRYIETRSSRDGPIGRYVLICRARLPLQGDRIHSGSAHSGIQMSVRGYEWIMGGRGPRNYRTGLGVARSADGVRTPLRDHQISALKRRDTHSQYTIYCTDSYGGHRVVGDP